MKEKQWTKQGIEMCRTHRGIKYKQLTKQSNPKEGDILYILPQSEDGDIPPLECKVTQWGAEHHNETDLWLIEVEQKYHPEFIEMIIKKYGKREAKKRLDTPKFNFVPLECLYEII